MIEPLRRETTKLGRDRQMVNAVQGRFENALQANQYHFQKVGTWYDVYRGLYTGKFHPHRSNIHLPFLFSVVQSDVSQKVLASFDQPPYVEMHGFGPEDGPRARRQSSLIAVQMKDARSFVKAHEFYTSSDLYGVAIGQAGWKYKEADRPGRVDVPDPVAGGFITEKQIERVIAFDGPDWQHHDILDVFQQPGKNDLHDMDWIIVRSWMDFDAIRAAEKAGVFDKGTAKQLQDSHYDYGRYKERQGYFRSPEDHDRGRRDMLSRPVEICTMYGTVPDELVPPKGSKFRLASVANGRVLMRNRDVPFWHADSVADIFFAYSPFRDPHTFHAPGKVEIGEKLQLMSDRFASQKTDILDRVADPLWAFSTMKGVHEEDLVSRPNGRIRVDSEDVRGAIEPIFPDLRGMQNITPEIFGQFWPAIQQGTGIIEDTVMGGSISKRQTAREFLGRQESVSKRLLLEVKLAEETWIEPLANIFRCLNRQYLDEGRMVRMIGVNALRDPATGQAIPPEPEFVSYDDMLDDYDIRALGTTKVLAKASRQQNLMFLMQMLSANPQAMARLNWETALRATIDAVDEKAEEWLALSPEQVAENIQVQNLISGGSNAQPASAAPEAAPGDDQGLGAFLQGGGAGPSGFEVIGGPV